MEGIFLSGMVVLMANNAFAAKPGFGDFTIGMTQREAAQLFRDWERDGNLLTPVRDSFIPDGVLSRWSVGAEGGFGSRFCFTPRNDKETAPVELSVTGKDALVWDTLNDIDGKRTMPVAGR